jgi:hypothetical protein
VASKGELSFLEILEELRASFVLIIQVILAIEDAIGIGLLFE